MANHKIGTPKQAAAVPDCWCAEFQPVSETLLASGVIVIGGISGTYSQLQVALDAIGGDISYTQAVSAAGEIVEDTVCLQICLPGKLEQLPDSVTIGRAIMTATWRPVDKNEAADLLQDLIKPCANPCSQSAVIGWCGRPNTTVAYSYGNVSGVDLESFNAAWVAAGGKTWIAAEDGVTGGECHWFCPAIPGAVFMIDGEVQDIKPVMPNPNAEICPPSDALCTIGCFDQAISNTLQDLLGKFCGVEDECCIATGELQVTSRCQSYRPDVSVGAPNATYGISVGGAFVDLPNPNTDADVIAALNSICGDWSIIGAPGGPRTLCNADLNCSSARFRVCTTGETVFNCQISTSAGLIVEPGQECIQVINTNGCYDQQIANDLTALLEQTKENKPFVLKDFFTCTEPTGQLRNREWIIGGRPDTGLISTAEGQAVMAAFDPTQTPEIEGPWTTLDANDTNNDPNTQDYQIIDGFLKVDEPCFMRWATGSAGYINVMIGVNCGPLETVVEGSQQDGTFNPTNSTLIPRGIHAFEMHNIDDWTNTSPAAFVSKDGVNFSATNVPDGYQLSDVKPIETTKCLKLCGDGSIVDPLTNMAVDAENCYLTPYGSPDDNAAALAELLQKQCDANDMASDALIKQCLTFDDWFNCAEKSELLEPITEESTDLCLETNAENEYNVGQTVALYDCVGDVAGSATVSGEATESEGKTIVPVTDIDISNGTDPEDIKEAKPVLEAAAGAVKATVTGVSILQASPRATPVRGAVGGIGTIGTIGDVTAVPRP